MELTQHSKLGLAPLGLHLSRQFFILILLGATRVAEAQTGADILNNAQMLEAQCTGELGSLVPECQAAKSSIHIPTTVQSGVGGSLPSVKGNAGSAAPERETPRVTSPPEPPTDFQRFIASSVGQVLPIFGANLFTGVPSTFAPLDRVPVTADYTIGPGDEILLRVWGQLNLDVSLTVDRGGAVFIPQAGNIHVSGIQFQQLPFYLRSQLERVFRNFDLTVSMGQLRSIQVFVVGAARRPGTYTVSALSTLADALFASGGPSTAGSMRRIQLKRSTKTETEFDLYDLLLRGDKTKDARMLPGDVIYIPAVGPQVAVAGSVHTAAVYELNHEQTVADLIGMAGGLSPVADVNHATLERIKDRSGRESMELRLDGSGARTVLADGDLLKVVTVNPRFENTVTLRGNVADPGRFPWHPGMRLREIIPDRESLITRNYWKKRNTLGFIAPGDVPAEPSVEADRKTPQTGINPAAPDINWAYAAIERQNRENLALNVIPFHLGKLVLEGDETQNLEVEPGDVVTVFSQADFRVAAAQQTRLVRLQGEFAAAGIYAARAGETLGQLIQRAGGLTPQAYLYAAEFTRESTRADQQRRLDQFVQELQQDVERTASNRIIGTSSPEQTLLVNNQLQNERTLVERLRTLKATGRIVLNLSPASDDINSLMDFPLEDNDSFLVPPKPATVNVLGAVYNQNSFVYQPNFRLVDYLNQAGGATRNADTARMFIIRADGSVVPRRGFSPFSHSFDSIPLNPGDSVLVPEAIFRGTFLQGLRDWSQVFGQLALGAAAINILK